MKRTTTALFPLVGVLAALILGACGAPAPAASSPEAAMPAKADVSAAMTDTHSMDAMTETHSMDAMTETHSMDAMTDTHSMDAMTETHSMDAMQLPAWAQMPLVDARTGATFTLADYAGKTVYIEPMATWCSNCRRQLTNLAEAQAQISDPNVVLIALSVETNLSAADLASYADAAGFGFTFAVMTPELLAELNATFGQTIANPPATPHFTISPDGAVSELITGIESVEELLQRIAAAGA